jgi:lipid II:glycine glycyltransferase (peptidoglycan interpeptide bridge formation enzyme)
LTFKEDYLQMLNKIFVKLPFLVLAEFNVPFERMKNIQKQINQLNCDLKRCMDEVKEIYTKQVERLQRERDTALLAASQIDDPNNINAQLPPGVEISNKKVS